MRSSEVVSAPLWCRLRLVNETDGNFMRSDRLSSHIHGQTDGTKGCSGDGLRSKFMEPCCALDRPRHSPLADELFLSEFACVVPEWRTVNTHDRQRNVVIRPGLRLSSNQAPRCLAEKSCGCSLALRRNAQRVNDAVHILKRIDETTARKDIDARRSRQGTHLVSTTKGFVLDQTPDDP